MGAAPRRAGRARRPRLRVEIGGGLGGRMQVRAVGFGAEPRDAARDRDMEAIWCEEFERLKALVADAGGAIVVEQALAVGAVSMKIIAADPTTVPDTIEVPVSRQMRRE